MFYFIVNPSSRSGKGRALWKQVEKELRLAHVKYEVFFTRYENHAKLLAKEICENKGKKTPLCEVPIRWYPGSGQPAGTLAYLPVAW